MNVTAGHGASVRIECCGKTFADGTRALEPATLDIARGETLVLLGPSGCGKTTMLRIIAGLELPDTGGRVLFDDKDVTSVPIENRNVGMVFQSYALFPNMTVADNIAYGLKIRGVGKSERSARVAELVALTNITGLENRRVDQRFPPNREAYGRPSLERRKQILMRDHGNGCMSYRTYGVIHFLDKQSLGIRHVQSLCAYRLLTTPNVVTCCAARRWHGVVRIFPSILPALIPVRFPVRCSRISIVHM